MEYEQEIPCYYMEQAVFKVLQIQMHRELTAMYFNKFSDTTMRGDCRKIHAIAVVALLYEHYALNYYLNEHNRHRTLS